VKDIEKWSLRYFLLKYFILPVYQIEHRKIVINGLENIPKDKPIIFAPNHQNALMDALAIVFSAPFQVVFLARADIFKRKIVASILTVLKIMPVFRMRDGKDTLDKNEEIFKHCVRILNRNRYLCLFPEAAHTNIKSMLPHKKAIPRIVFQAGEQTDFAIDIQIVPVGIYYTHYFNFRRSIVVNYGKPISVKPFFNIFKEEGELKATVALRDELYHELSTLCVNVPERGDYELYNQSFELYRKNSCRKLGLKNHPKNFIKAEQYIISKIEDYSDTNFEEKQEMLKVATAYKELKSRLKLSDSIIEKGGIGLMEIIWNMLIIWFLIPFSLYGFLVNLAPFWLTRYSFRGNIKDRQFYSSFCYGLSIIVYPLWFLVVFIFVCFVLNNWLYALALVLFSIPCGIIAWGFTQRLIAVYNRVRISQLLKDGNSDLKNLLNCRNSILGFLDKITNR
jgi:1-acyl-sn-glycerol-3-phosphate acyltransferase